MFMMSHEPHYHSSHHSEQTVPKGERPLQSIESKGLKEIYIISLELRDWKEGERGNDSGNQLNAFLDLVLTNEKLVSIFLQLIHILKTDFTH